MDYTTLGLPPSVTSIVEFTPYEDIGRAILLRGLPGMAIHTAVPPPDYLEFPFILIYRAKSLELYRGNPRFTDQGRVLVSVFATAPNEVEKAQVVSEAVRVVMNKASREKWSFPGMGSIIRAEMKNEPSRSGDWATSAGPVQFADLPSNTVRYEATYKITVRRPFV